MKIRDIIFDWKNQTWKTKILVGLPLAALVFGWYYYDRSREAAAMHAEMLTMCAGDQPCVAAVDQFAEGCFKEHYSMGRRRHGVRMAEFVDCVNEKSGTQHFVVEKTT